MHLESAFNLVDWLFKRDAGPIFAAMEASGILTYRFNNGKEIRFADALKTDVSLDPVFVLIIGNYNLIISD